MYVDRYEQLHINEVNYVQFGTETERKLQNLTNVVTIYIF